MNKLDLRIADFFAGAGGLGTGYEKEFDLTIHRTKSVIERVNSGSSFNVNQNMVDIALSNKYTLPIYVGDEWKLPQGAFGDLSGSL